jgi:hypothetical protein
VDEGAEVAEVGSALFAAAVAAAAEAVSEVEAGADEWPAPDLVLA